MAKMKLAIALNLIKQKERNELKALHANQRNQRRLERKMRAEAKDKKKSQENLCKYISSLVVELPPERKSIRVWKTCKCGRKFSVLTHHKQVKRKLCRVCKPY